jgi:CxxC motif-containing protein (DUF1111 family)
MKFSRILKASRTNMKKAAAAAAIFLIFPVGLVLDGQTATDPGLRPPPIDAGTFVGGLSSQQTAMLPDFTTAFNRVVAVPNVPGKDGSPNNIPPVFGGLGPVFNSNSCTSCHAAPANGGSSPASNPLFSIYQLDGATNTMPSFITTTSPVLVPRFPYQSDLITPDGTVHQLFTIQGRKDAVGCTLAQPNFATAASQNNLVFRQPIPLFGDGMIDLIQDTDIINGLNSNLTLKQSLGIGGAYNRITNDASVARFGWKASIKSLKEMVALEQTINKGVSNVFFPNEQNETAGCVLNAVPEDGDNYPQGLVVPVPQRDQFTGDTQRATLFVRFLDQPTPAVPLGTTNGQVQFNNIGCNLCHTQTFVTPLGSIMNNNIQVNLFSDVLIHHMGNCLADNITQGTATGDMFRTAPLWGAGQRIFFLHDGRTSNIVTAVEDHFCNAAGAYGPSEANAVINAFNALSPGNQQDLISFLRNL